MSTSSFNVSWYDPNGGMHTTVGTIVDNAATANPSFPLILLLHGGGGNINDMANPALNYGPIMCDVNWAPPAKLDRGWHAYPNAGIWGFNTSPSKSGSGLQGALAQFGYTVLNYGQAGPNDTIQLPAAELDALVHHVLENYFSTKRLILVCHSRGGLLARLFLQRNRNDLDILNRIAGVVTLHTPHLGSEVADVVSTLHNGIMALASSNPAPAGSPAHDIIDQGLGLIDKQVINPCILELKPSSAFLADLAAQEATPLPVAIPIHTFGGTNPRLLSLFVSNFDAISALPQWHLPPFHWITSQSLVVNLLDGTPVANACPEERAGGDLLVADACSHLPFEASHHTEQQNHATALCDTALQADLRAVLATMRSNAAFVSQGVPPSMIGGKTYPVSIMMKNTGTSTWMPGVHFPFCLASERYGDNPPSWSIWGMGHHDVPAPVPPGTTVRFDFSVTAPAAAGSYHFQWRMRQDGVEAFGETTPDVLVSVTAAAVAAA